MKARLNGYEMRIAVEAAAHKICTELQRKPVRITWDYTTTTAAISNSGQIKLANVHDDTIVTRPVFDRYVGFILHELLHHRYTDFDKRSDDRYVFQLHNAIEDAWIEHQCIDNKLVGNAEGLLGSLIEGMSAEALVEVTDWSNPAQYPFVLAVYLRNHAKTKMPVANGLEPVFKEAAVRLTTAKSSADTLAIAEWVYAQLQSLPQTQQQKPQTQQRPTSGDEKGSQAGEKGSTSPDQEEVEGEGAGQGDSPSVGDATSPTDKKGNLKAVPREVEPQTKSPDGEGSGGYYDKHAGLAKTHLQAEQRPNYMELNAVGGRLRYNLKKLFDNSGTSEHQRNRRTGSINVQALHSIAAGNDRVFKRRLDVEGIDSAVVIVVDCSGSMFPTKADPAESPINNALATCVALVESLNAAQVSTAVLTFGCETAVLKGFNAPAKRLVADVPRIRPAGGTNDYFAVRLAHEMLLGRTEKRKVCFVITDGRGDVADTTAQVKSGANLGITTIGIGIKANVADIYPNNVRVDEVQALGKMAFDKIKLAA
jgi:cobalamin biosynthesis protein CobT